MRIRQELYEIYCQRHGAAGNGNVVEEKKFLGFLAIKTELSPKEVFLCCDLWFKLNGFSCNQLDMHERWLIADYVLKLKNQL
jgi:hypothetical protein